jgi:uncharacterized protein (DUF1499 family)
MWKRLIGLAILVVVGAVFVLAMFSFMAKEPKDLGVQDGKLLSCPDSPNCVGSMDADAGHHVEPLAFTGDPKGAMARLKAVVEAQPNTRIVDDERDYLHAECRSMIFRFVDDLEFYLDTKEKKIHVRSGSRAGKYDFGVNRRRVEAIRKAFDAAGG